MPYPSFYDWMQGPRPTVGNMDPASQDAPPPSPTGIDPMELKAVRLGMIAWFRQQQQQAGEQPMGPPAPQEDQGTPGPAAGPPQAMNGPAAPQEGPPQFGPLPGRSSRYGTEPEVEDYSRALQTEKYYQGKADAAAAAQKRKGEEFLTAKPFSYLGEGQGENPLPSRLEANQAQMEQNYQRKAEREQELQRRADEIYQQQREYAQSNIDPDAIFKGEDGTWNKIRFALMAGIGGYLNPRGENRGLTAVNQIIERNIAAQENDRKRKAQAVESELEGLRIGYKASNEKFENDEARRIAAWQMVALEAKTIGEQTSDAMIKANADRASAEADVMAKKAALDSARESMRNETREHITQINVAAANWRTAATVAPTQWEKNPDNGKVSLQPDLKSGEGKAYTQQKINEQERHNVATEKYQHDALEIKQMAAERDSAKAFGATLGRGLEPLYSGDKIVGAATARMAPKAQENLVKFDNILAISKETIELQDALRKSGPTQRIVEGVGIGRVDLVDRINSNLALMKIQLGILLERGANYSVSEQELVDSVQSKTADQMLTPDYSARLRNAYVHITDMKRRYLGVFPLPEKRSSDMKDAGFPQASPSPAQPAPTPSQPLPSQPATGRLPKGDGDATDY